MIQMVKDDREKIRLLGEMVDFNSSKSHMTGNEWWSTLIRYSIKMPVVWSIYKSSRNYDNERLYLEKYLSNNPAWHHGNAEKNSGHNELGMAYSAWAMENTGISELQLSDSPDLSGLIGNNCMHGDIGTCTPLAFLNGIRSSSMHDIWVSVFGLDYQIILEFNYYAGAFIGNLINFGTPIDYTEIERCFYCPEHETYTITKESRRQLLRKLGFQELTSQIRMPI